MHIEIQNTDLETRIHKQMQSIGAASVEDALRRLLETQEEQDRWLQENQSAIDLKIQCGIGQLARGEGIPEDRLDAHLAALKKQPE